MTIFGCTYPSAMDCIAALQASKTIQWWSLGQGMISVRPIDRHPATLGEIREIATRFGGQAS